MYPWGLILGHQSEFGSSLEGHFCSKVEPWGPLGVVLGALGALGGSLVSPWDTLGVSNCENINIYIGKQ